MYVRSLFGTQELCCDPHLFNPFNGQQMLKQDDPRGGQLSFGFAGFP